MASNSDEGDNDLNTSIKSLQSDGKFFDIVSPAPDVLFFKDRHRDESGCLLRTNNLVPRLLGVKSFNSN